MHRPATLHHVLPLAAGAVDLAQVPPAGTLWWTEIEVFKITSTRKIRSYDEMSLLYDYFIRLTFILDSVWSKQFIAGLLASIGTFSLLCLLFSLLPRQEPHQEQQTAHHYRPHVLPSGEFRDFPEGVGVTADL